MSLFSHGFMEPKSISHNGLHWRSWEFEKRLSGRDAKQKMSWWNQRIETSGQVQPRTKPAILLMLKFQRPAPILPMHCCIAALLDSSTGWYKNYFQEESENARKPTAIKRIKSWSENPQIKRGHGFAHLSHIVFWKQVGKIEDIFIWKAKLQFTNFIWFEKSCLSFKIRWETFWYVTSWFVRT